MENRLLREKILVRLGRFPSKVPLEAVFEEPIAEEGYTRTRVTYMVEPGEVVPAWLLHPHGEKPKKGWPAILAIHRDSEHCELGKGEVAGSLAIQCTTMGGKSAYAAMWCCAPIFSATRSAVRRKRSVDDGRP